MPADDLDSFIREAALTRKLKHKYIVDYIGVGEFASWAWAGQPALAATLADMLVHAHLADD